jgi:diguanylate cyclase (GGDEF)-like protein/PAS domain S-box-containing protein
MNDVGKPKTSLRRPGHSEARAAAALLVAAAAFVGLSLVLPHPDEGNLTALLATALGMGCAGALCLGFAARVPRAAVHAVIALTVLTTGALILESGIAAGQYGSIFVWATLICSYYFPRRIAAAHLAWLLVVYAGTLAAVESTAGYSPVTRWLFTAVSLGVVMLLITEVVARRARADVRARRFFDLSQDMLSTMDPEGRCVEVNESWWRQLGYRSEDLLGRPLIDITHPEDREYAGRAAAAAFTGGGSGGIETRVHAKDGSWHWLRTSWALAPDENLIYARSTDVTELKRVEAEREELLAEVESLARSDALTGLPNRRVLSEQLAQEMARARRSGAELCLAVIDVDHFKLYNDSHGHLAGDALLRAAAIAWDGVLRGGDTIARFGGEEFVVVLPDTAPAEAAAIVERLRAATPGGCTCSAGLSRWDCLESAEELVGRADAALYRAKHEGRDRLVAATAGVQA